MSDKAGGSTDRADDAERRRNISHEHHHRGKSSESLLDKGAILRALEIVPGSAILDAGCGNGYMAKAFSRLVGDSGVVYALDPDEEAIAQLLSEVAGTNIQAVVDDITTTTQLAAASVDLVYSCTVLHGFSPDQIGGFRQEIARVSKPQARLAIVEIDKRDTPFGPAMDLRFSPEELCDALRLSPLKLVRAGEYFYMQIFGVR